MPSIRLLLTLILARFPLHLLQKTEVHMLLFVADSLACFPYQTQEEPLFIMHHIDITLSVSGSNLLQSFKEVRLFCNLPIYFFGCLLSSQNKMT